MSIDIETYSSVDLINCGVYKYTEAEDFEILLFAYAFDDDEVQVIDLASGQVLPTLMRSVLMDKEVIKTAYNANFEITCLNKYFRLNMPAESWRCTAVHSAYLGLPGALDKVAKALDLEAQKDSKGKSLIRYFSVPCAPTKVNGGRTRNLPEHATEKWKQYKEYCKQDVEVERYIRKILEKYPMPSTECHNWYIDQDINNRGVVVDLKLVDKAIECDEENKKRLLNEAVSITGIENFNSVAQVKEWLETQGLIADSLDKENVKKYINEETGNIKRVLELRQELSKTSIKKYEAIKRAVCDDGRVRGLFQFYGANRTGRWAGRLVQVQNLRRNSLKSLHIVRGFVKKGMFEEIEILYDSTSDVLSQLIRTAFIPENGQFVIADFSAIEARVIAWLAGETWRNEVFKTHGKIYEASASQMFRIPIEEVTKDLRQKGKISELALGYGGGPNALIQMGALEMGLKEEELEALVNSWRAANPNITNFWKELNHAAIAVIKKGGRSVLPHGIAFTCTPSFLKIDLPSGRSLHYVKPKLTKNRFGGESIGYWGVDGITKQWTLQETYGGKLAENIVQAVARDCMAETLYRLHSANVVMHIHDEVVIDGECDLQETLDIMCEPISWAKGLELRADGFYTTYYKKD